ncbi:DNA starvation/stationary phase protection protein [Flavobacterium sp.]|uniref:Dps family protein n=1 Tax=Flavobacterium sp. TaxID=239 RepID=UPI0026093354|nr:DNA starvation/stationary phase protection protein [Flavobacterium sp.]
MIGINAENRLKVAENLNRILADEYLLYTQTRKAHWNVEGADFYLKHKLFEDQYEIIDDIIDEIAERIRSIGHYVPASLREFLELTHLSELNRKPNDSDGFIQNLLEYHESIILKLREQIKPFAEQYHDLGSSDFITGVLEKHEKMAWMLRASLSHK